jgi:thymidylate kinase
MLPTQISSPRDLGAGTWGMVREGASNIAFPPPNRFLIEGIDRVGKDTLIREIQERLGYHLVLHYTKPIPLAFYQSVTGPPASRQYQEASFRTMFHLLRQSPEAPIICNRSHVGEYVYAPLYRNYSGAYVFDVEQLCEVSSIPRIRLLLLTEDFEHGRHFRDDGLSLGSESQRHKEQDLFLEAFARSTILDKRVVCVTDTATGNFRAAADILDEALR